MDRYNGNFFTLIFFATAVGFVSLVLFTKTFPLIASKAIYYCQQFASNTFFQIPHTFPHTIIIALGIILVLGILSFIIQLYRTQTLLKNLHRKKVNISSRLSKIVEQLGLFGKIYAVEDNNLFSFCYGLFFPKIIISTSLINSLSNQELEAVLLHEKAHLKNRDPFKVLVGKAISSMFFFLPIFPELNKNIAATNELLADRFVSDYQGSSTFLKSALKKILSAPEINFATVPAISNSDHLEIRIHKLINPTFDSRFGFSYLSIITSILFVVMSFFLLQSPVSAFQMKDSQEISYFVCSSGNNCSKECDLNAQSKIVTSPQQLFTNHVQETKDAQFSPVSSSIYKYSSQK